MALRERTHLLIDAGLAAGVAGIGYLVHGSQIDTAAAAALVPTAKEVARYGATGIRARWASRNERKKQKPQKR